MGANSPVFRSFHFNGRNLKENLYVKYQWSDENDAHKENIGVDSPQKKDSLKKGSDDRYNRSMNGKRKRNSTAKSAVKKRRRMEEDHTNSTSAIEDIVGSSDVKEDEKELPLTTSSDDEGVALSLEDVPMGIASLPEQNNFPSSPDCDEISGIRKALFENISHISETSFDEEEIYIVPETSFEDRDISHISETEEDAFDRIEFTEDETYIPNSVEPRFLVPLKLIFGPYDPPRWGIWGELPDDPIENSSADEAGISYSVQSRFLVPLVFVPGSCEYIPWRVRGELLDDPIEGFSEDEESVSYSLGPRALIPLVLVPGDDTYVPFRLYDRWSYHEVDDPEDPINDFSDSDKENTFARQAVFSNDSIHSEEENKSERETALPQSTQAQGSLPKKTVINNVSFFRQKNGEMIQQTCVMTEQGNFLTHWRKVRW